MSAPERRLLRAEEVAMRYSVSRNYVYKCAREGKLPSVRLGRIVRFDPLLLEEFDKKGGFLMEFQGI